VPNRHGSRPMPRIQSPTSRAYCRVERPRSPRRLPSFIRIQPFVCMSAFGPKADIPMRSADVRFRGNSGHRNLIASRLLLTRSRL
jgi:hypothetical protein